jgi:phenylalanyl-tRNA synthetase alpha chain
MISKINEVKEQIKNLIINNAGELEESRIKYLGKKGIITEFLNELKNMNNEEKREFGKLINDLKDEISFILENKNKELKEQTLNDKLNEEAIDVSLPATKLPNGKMHILDKVIEELEELFISLGFEVLEGPEVEEDLYNFELLNLPKGHPARDAQDSFYITENMLLRSQTSPVQARTMLANEEKSPIKIICPGKTYRRDDDDPSHSHQFMQIEGLVIDKEISLAHLKGTLEIMVKKLFGENVECRFRPSFYPFTEPSVEFDISCFNCDKKGCPVCKKTGWITVGGAGIVHPNVLNNCGYDSNKYSGFAFGFGIERLTMIKYGINDIRMFYTNDLRVEHLSEKEG